MNRVHRIEMARLSQLRGDIDFDWEEKSVLYIGANKARFHFKEFLKENKCIVDVLEIDRWACRYLRTLDWINVIEGSVLEVLSDKKYDVIFWSHGPETVERKHFEPLMENLYDITKEVLIIMVPWGRYSYTEERLKKLSRSDNITTFYEEDFSSLGFETSVLGKKDRNGSNLLAWKFKEEE